MKEQLSLLTEGTQTRPLRELGSITAGVTLGRREHAADGREVPYLRVANVKDGHLDLSDVQRIRATEAEIDELRLRRGDLLLTEGGDADKLGRGTFWSEELPECIHQNHIFRVRFDPAVVDYEYAALLLRSDYGRRYFFKHGKQTTGIATI